MEIAADNRLYLPTRSALVLQFPTLGRRLAVPDSPTKSIDSELTSGDDLTDSEVIVRSFTDPGEFSKVVNRHWKVLYGYLARRFGRDLAEDITSETFTRAFAMRHRFNVDADSARPWLFGIASNLFRTHRRSEMRALKAYARAAADNVPLDIDEQQSVNRADASMTNSVLAEALSHLNTGDREALLLYAWGDMSYEEIGQVLGIPTGTVRSRLNRARREMKNRLPETVSERDHSDDA